MLNFFKNFNLIAQQIQNSLIPAGIFACAFLGYFSYGEISVTAQNNLHIILWSCSICTLGILSFFNRQKPLFFLLSIVLEYIIINWLKREYSLDYLSTNAYINLCFFAPINLTIFYFMHNRNLINNQTLYLFIFIFFEIAVGEYLDKHDIAVSFNSDADGINLNSLSVLLFLCFLTAAFIKCGLSGHIEDTALFFSGLNIFAGFYYSASSTALCIFFSSAVATLLTGTIKNILYSLQYDFLTGLSGRRAYLKESEKFPLKYSLAIICLDNFEHIEKIFGHFKSNQILKMLANRLQELEPENPIYRYSTDEFIIVFKNDNLKKSFEKLDNIRREIAASKFMFSHKQKGIKITISGCVSEKKRSDSNATEVLLRTRKTLQKTYQFTQNLISKS